MNEKDKKLMARIAGWVLFLILIAMLVPDIGGYSTNLIGRLPAMWQTFLMIFALAVGSWRLGVVSDIRGALKR
jgi:hypothetical protein